MPNSNSPANSNNVNTVQTATQQNSINTDENPEISLVSIKSKTRHQKIHMSFYKFYQLKYQTEINLLQ